MAWKGFVKESKSYMGYGKAISKINFWIKFPKAALKFYWPSVKGALLRRYNGLFRQSN